MVLRLKNLVLFTSLATLTWHVQPQHVKKFSAADITTWTILLTVMTGH